MFAGLGTDGEMRIKTTLHDMAANVTGELGEVLVPITRGHGGRTSLLPG
jgi:hypothetical protein